MAINGILLYECRRSAPSIQGAYLSCHYSPGKFNLIFIVFCLVNFAFSIFGFLRQIGRLATSDRHQIGLVSFTRLRVIYWCLWLVVGMVGLTYAMSVPCRVRTTLPSLFSAARVATSSVIALLASQGIFWHPQLGGLVACWSYGLFTSVGFVRLCSSPRRPPWSTPSAVGGGGVEQGRC